MLIKGTKYAYSSHRPLKSRRLQLTDECTHIQLSNIPSLRHLTAAATDDLWQFRMPEYLRALEVVSQNIGIPPMNRSAVRPGDDLSFRDLHHAPDLIVGASLQAVQVMKAGKSRIVPSKRPPMGAKFDREEACTLVVVSSVSRREGGADEPCSH